MEKDEKNSFQPLSKNEPCKGRQMLLRGFLFWPDQMVGENHLISVSTTSGPALSETFVYDGDGNRVSQTINGVTTNFLVDTNNLTGYAQVLEEIQGSTVQMAYTYGTTRISQDAFNGSSYVTSYFGYDGQGSVRFLMDSTGNVTDQYTYSSFGENLFTSGSTSNAFKYDGEQVDGNTGFYNLRARWMNPVVGRFQTMDSFEGNQIDPLSLHKYTFGQGDPVNNSDPSGNDSNTVGSAETRLLQGLVEAGTPSMIDLLQRPLNSNYGHSNFGFGFGYNIWVVPPFQLKVTDQSGHGIAGLTITEEISAGGTAGLFAALGNQIGYGRHTVTTNTQGAYRDQISWYAFDPIPSFGIIVTQLLNIKDNGGNDYHAGAVYDFNVQNKGGKLTGIVEDPWPVNVFPGKAF